MALDAWLIFVGVWFLAGTPLGPNALNCISVSAAQGVARSLWCVLGVLLAGLFFIALVSVGFAALLASHADLFTALKLAGALYLIWMGASAWRRAGAAKSAKARSDTSGSARGLVVRAFAISLSNPKAILAYGAVFSQFVSADAALGAQLAVLVPTALVINAAIYTGYCVAGAGVGRLLSSPVRQRIFDRTVAGFFVFAGAGLIAGELGRRG